MSAAVVYLMDKRGSKKRLDVVTDRDREDGRRAAAAYLAETRARRLLRRGRFIELALIVGAVALVLLAS